MLQDTILQFWGTWSQWIATINATLIVQYSGSFVFLLVLSFLIKWVSLNILIKWIQRATLKTKTQLDDALLQHRFFHRLSHIPSAIVLYIGASFLPPIQVFLERVAMIYITCIGFLLVSSFLNALQGVYEKTDMARRRPIKSYLQITKATIFVLTVLFILAHFLDKSPWKLLSGIGAMSAVLLLIFRDSLLGLIAGFLLTANKMVQIGDWIEVPKHNADGEILEITLTSVKIRNWDKTITTLPTYFLISDSFKNWEGMSQSGGRRIKRAFYIDINSITFCTPEMIKAFKQVDCLKEYMDQKLKEVSLPASSSHSNKHSHSLDASQVNQRNLTNIGTFRAYLTYYLQKHPEVQQNMTCMVRQLKPTENGLPLEVYIFSKTKAWVQYEGIQADIFDHILAVLPFFQLRIHQMPTGQDFSSLGSLPN
jgi:miniconductance mechanosensitive channel